MGKRSFGLVAAIACAASAFALADVNQQQCLNTVEISIKAADQPLVQVGPKCRGGDLKCASLGKTVAQAADSTRARLKNECVPLVKQKCETYAQNVADLGAERAWQIVMNGCSLNALDPNPNLVNCACTPVDFAQLRAAVGR